jgi:hypothetical protein
VKEDSLRGLFNEGVSKMNGEGKNGKRKKNDLLGGSRVGVTVNTI